MARSESTISVLQLEEHAARHARFAADEGLPRLERSCASEIRDKAALVAFAGDSELPNRDFVTIIPRHQATLRILTLPSRDPAEIASMVSLASEELAPYPREQLVVRHRILGAIDTGESRVLVALVHRDVIEQHVERLGAAGLEPRHIFLSTACLHAAACASPDAPAGSYALACVSPDALEVLVIHHGLLAFSRGVAHHGPWNLDEAGDRDALGYEIRDALAAWRRESDTGEALDQLYVVGDGLDGDALATTLSPVTGKSCRPAQFLAVFPGNRPNQAGGPEDAVIACGAALCAWGRASLSFDFLPPAIAQSRSVREVQAGVRRVAVLACVVLGLALAAFGQSVYQRLALIHELRAQLESLSPGEEDTAARQRGLQAIARQLEQGGNFLALLAAVAEAAPEEGLNITRVEYDRETGMNVWGRARTKDLVLGDFLGRLRQMGEGSLAQLAQAHSQYETAGEERGQQIVNYHIAIPALSEEPSRDVSSPAR
ncbi:MAG: hypothetical protein JNK74_11375 [Candidatus Hydrogenedentes bacterium]|nr:hypothetical protein [Candidatus Hydrogenedentota bacterium]